jgi:hypothetical protein
MSMQHDSVMTSKFLHSPSDGAALFVPAAEE